MLLCFRAPMPIVIIFTSRVCPRDCYKMQINCRLSDIKLSELVVHTRGTPTNLLLQTDNNRADDARLHFPHHTLRFHSAARFLHDISRDYFYRWNWLWVSGCLAFIIHTLEQPRGGGPEKLSERDNLLFFFFQHFFFHLHDELSISNSVPSELACDIG